MNPMMQKEKKKIPYYNVGDDKVGFAATTGKRLGGRLFDLFLVGLIPMIIDVS
jgi:hypothetical protein